MNSYFIEASKITYIDQTRSRIDLYIETPEEFPVLHAHRKSIIPAHFNVLQCEAGDDRFLLYDGGFLAKVHVWNNVGRQNTEDGRPIWRYHVRAKKGHDLSVSGYRRGT